MQVIVHANDIDVLRAPAQLRSSEPGYEVEHFELRLSVVRSRVDVALVQ
jgi:hypothetical protein